MMVAIVYIITYLLGSYSSRSGSMSLRVMAFSLLYFFGSTIFLYIGVEWMSAIARERVQEGASFYLNIGASGLALAAVLHIFCGLLTILLYVRGQMSQGLILQRIKNSLRTRKRVKSKRQ
ncbi:MAG: hypothetical protein PVF15_11070 [Candidatus Bathyarchaeota archaeon]